MVAEVDYFGGGGTYELEHSNQNATWSSPLTFSNKKGKKLVLTIYTAWYTGMDSDYAKITTISGGTITNTIVLNDATSSGNHYSTGRCYEIDVTSDTLSCTLAKSSVYGTAVFV